ncbi:hypothetical protein, partial [Mycobacterium tuberculosis]|uniref:hypothetical protein n=1 Tax=Mycobacterium tuberculosis TaxID=1773 RepID=UPI001BFF349B
VEAEAGIRDRVASRGLGDGNQRQTHNNTHGHTEWLPPPHLDHGQPRTNTFHHPERFLHNQDDDDEPD